MTTPMSDAAATVLFGGVPEPLEAGDLAGYGRRLSQALDAAGPGTLAVFALKALQTFPPVPPNPDLDFDLPMPTVE